MLGVRNYNWNLIGSGSYCDHTMNIKLKGYRPLCLFPIEQNVYSVSFGFYSDRYKTVQMKSINGVSEVVDSWLLQWL